MVSRGGAPGTQTSNMRSYDSGNDLTRGQQEREKNGGREGRGGELNSDDKGNSYFHFLTFTNGMVVGLIYVSWIYMNGGKMVAVYCLAMAALKDVHAFS